MKSTLPFSVCAVVMACLSFVNAHGSVSQFVANGKTHRGPLPGSGSGQESPVRVISTLDPITDPNSAGMACGPGAAASARVVADVDAGSDVAFGWTSGPSMKWPHRWGPVLLYAYQCPGDNAADCKPPTGDGWFLIDAAGFDPNPDAVPPNKDSPPRSGWVQDRFRANMTVPAHIPKGMPNGAYLLRHEIIALHVAMDRGAEYYVSCTQVNIKGGSNSAKAQGAELVKFPGAYNRNDPGLRVNVFDDGLNAKTYKMPGPKLFVGSATSDDNNDNEGGSSPAPKPTKTSTPQPAQTPTKQPTRCNVKRSDLHNKKRSVKHMSRAFKRDLVTGMHS